MEVTRSRVERVTISEIVLPAESFKENDPQLFAKLKASIAKRGQLKTVVLCINFDTNRYECLEGSKIVLAMRDLAHETIMAVLIADKLTQDEKKQIRLELSRDYFQTNYVLIGKMLKELAQTQKLNDLCATIPFDTRQAENLISMSDFDWEAFAQNKAVEGQISMFDMFSDNEPNYENVPLVEINPDYAEPVKIEPDLKPKDAVENNQPLGGVFEITIENKKDDQSVVRFGTLDAGHTEKDLFSVGDQLANKFEVDGYTVISIPKEVADEIDELQKKESGVEYEAAKPQREVADKKAIEKYGAPTLSELSDEKQERILEDVAPELYEPSIIEEVIAEGTSKEEFDKILDSRPDAEKNSFESQTPVPEPEQLIDTDQPFYVDHRNVLVVKQSKEIILMNLPSIAKSILAKKQYETDDNFEPSRVKITTQDEGENLIISHVLYVNKYDVRYTIQLKDVCEILTKIDFE